MITIVILVIVTGRETVHTHNSPSEVGVQLAVLIIDDGQSSVL